MEKGEKSIMKQYQQSRPPATPSKLLGFATGLLIFLSEIGLRTPGVNPGVKARSRRLQVFVRRFCYHVDMKIKLSAHGAYHHQYHVVWIPKYRKKGSCT